MNAPSSPVGQSCRSAPISNDYGKDVWLSEVGARIKEKQTPGYLAALRSVATVQRGPRWSLTLRDYKTLCAQFGPQDDADCDPNAPHICAASYRIAARQQQGLPILTTPEVQQARKAVCQSCDACVPVTHHASRITESLCTLSACSMTSKVANKIKYVHETCPQGFWSS